MGGGMARVDAIVIGGGPAGASTALGLARAGVSVLLVERGDGSGNPIGESLAPSATPLLHRLGLHETLLATRPLPCPANRSAWGGDGSLAESHFLRDPHGPGWHLDRPAFNAALLASAENAGVVCRRHATVRHAERDRSGTWRLQVADPTGRQEMAARLAIDASGRRAGFTAGLGVRRHPVDRLVAVVAFLRPTVVPLRDGTTLVEATEHGWWYSALLPDGRLAATFFTDPDLLAALRAWRPIAWRTLLDAAPHTHTRIVAHGFAPCGAPRVSAASSSCLAPLAGDGWLAVGDAAATFDPLSSNGIASALAAGQRAADAAVAWLDHEADALAAYADWVAAGYARYLWYWQAYYAAERRWPTAPFWRRRHEWTHAGAAWHPESID
jgi:flavin-dependent dehydrogenase